MYALSMILRVLLVLFHCFQFIVSSTGGLYYSLVLAVLLIGVQLYSPAAFVQTFKFSPNGVAVAGTVLWMIIAVMEFPMNDHPT